MNLRFVYVLGSFLGAALAAGAFAVTQDQGRMKTTVTDAGDSQTAAAFLLHR